MLFDLSSLPAAMLFFRLSCLKCVLHASQHEVCKEFVQQTYVGNGKSDTDLAALVFGSILKSVLCQEDGIFPVVSTSLITCSKAFKKSSGECFKSSATSPKSSPLFPMFRRDIACLNSAIVQGGSVNVGIVMGGEGSPCAVIEHATQPLLTNIPLQDCKFPLLEMEAVVLHLLAPHSFPHQTANISSPTIPLSKFMKKIDDVSGHKINMSSAKLNLNKFGPLSIKSMPSSKSMPTVDWEGKFEKQHKITVDWESSFLAHRLWSLVIGNWSLRPKSPTISPCCP